MKVKHRRRLNWCVPVLILAVFLVTSVTIADVAAAQDVFDFLFGGSQRMARPSETGAHPPPAPDVGRIAPPPLGRESVIDGAGSTGHSVIFCVRLCDGRHFPIENMVKGTPVETCRATCPYSRTKVFVGSEIGGAVAPDGQRYGNLDTAFLYRKQLVANCTCNGKDGLGLSAFDVMNDPTLRKGDIVSTKDGLMTYTGKSEQGVALAPVNPAALPADIRPGLLQSQLPSSTASTGQNTPLPVGQSEQRRP